ncbi:MAG: phage holin family protein [Patescibacteria group bacterium]
MKILIHLVLSTIAVLISAYLIPGVVVSGFTAALLVAIVLGVLNAFLRPILIVLTLPVTVLTFGLFALVINTLMIMLASAIVPGFAVASFGTAFLFGIVLSLVSAFMKMIGE